MVRTWAKMADGRRSRTQRGMKCIHSRSSRPQDMAWYKKRPTRHTIIWARTYSIIKAIGRVTSAGSPELLDDCKTQIVFLQPLQAGLLIWVSLLSSNLNAHPLVKPLYSFGITISLMWVPPAFIERLLLGNLIHSRVSLYLNTFCNRRTTSSRMRPYSFPGGRTSQLQIQSSAKDCSNLKGIGELLSICIRASHSRAGYDGLGYIQPRQRLRNNSLTMLSGRMAGTMARSQQVCVYLISLVRTFLGKDPVKSSRNFAKPSTTPRPRGGGLYSKCHSEPGMEWWSQWSGGPKGGGCFPRISGYTIPKQMLNLRYLVNGRGLAILHGAENLLGIDKLQHCRSGC